MSLGWLLITQGATLDNESKTTSIYDAIKEAHLKKSSIYAWQLDGEVLLKAELLIESYKIDRNEIILQTNPGMEHHLIQMITGLGKLNFYVASASLLFTSDVKKLEEGGKLTIAFPFTHTFHDRRELSRFEILGLPLSLKYNLKEREIKKPCFDLSRGGLSILYSQGERVPFKEGELIKGLHLEFGSHSLPFEATAVRILKLKPFMLEKIPYGGAKLSLKFETMDPKDKEILEKLNLQIEELLKKKNSSS